MRRPNKRNFVKREEIDQHRINDKIFARQIRLIIDGQEPVVMATSEALKLADEKELDLVEISPKADPPVCKIMDYRKFLYNQKKKEKELKAKQSKVELKEIRFGPNTDDHDFDFKLVHAKKFLSEGNKVKAYVKLAQELADYGVIEQLPKLEGKRMIMMINSKKK
jgi:translation initiation factor IF-3